jgi:hypothetical protein
MPDGFLEELASLRSRAPEGAGRRLRHIYWDVIYALWGFAPDACCAAVLEELELTRLDFGFWGIYLDALVNAGRARRALVEVARALDVQPQLGWANAAYRRLPRIWQALGVHGFAWKQEDGVAALRSRLAARPQPKMAGLVALRTSGAQAPAR